MLLIQKNPIGCSLTNHWDDLLQTIEMTSYKPSRWPLTNHQDDLLQTKQKIINDKAPILKLN